MTINTITSKDPPWGSEIKLAGRGAVKVPGAQLPTESPAISHLEKFGNYCYYHNQLNEHSTSAVHRISQTMRYITYSARHQHSVRLSSVCLSVRLSKRDEVTNRQTDRQTDRQTEQHWQMLCFAVYRAEAAQWRCWAYSIAVWQWRYYVQLINLNNQHYNAE